MWFIFFWSEITVTANALTWNNNFVGSADRPSSRFFLCVLSRSDIRNDSRCCWWTVSVRKHVLLHSIQCSSLTRWTDRIFPDPTTSKSRYSVERYHGTPHCIPVWIRPHSHPWMKCLRKWIHNLKVPALRSNNMIILYYITLHHITLHHISSHYITLLHITSQYITLHHITSHFITLHHITSHYIPLHHITSHYITLLHITSHYITLHHITLHYLQRVILGNVCHCEWLYIENGIPGDTMTQSNSNNSWVQ